MINVTMTIIFRLVFMLTDKLYQNTTIKSSQRNIHLHLSNAIGYFIFTLCQLSYIYIFSLHVVFLISFIYMNLHLSSLDSARIKSNAICYIYILQQSSIGAICPHTDDTNITQSMIATSVLYLIYLYG